MNNLIYNNIGFKPIEEEELTELESQEGEENVSPVTQDKETDSALSSPSLKSYADKLGIDTSVDAYYDKDREKYLKNREKANNIGNALRLLGQGIYGSKGMLIERDETDTISAKTQDELSKMRAAYDVDQRRARDMNISNAMTNLRTNFAYNKQEEMLDKRLKSSAEQKDKGYQEATNLTNLRHQNTLKEIDARIKGTNDPEKQKVLLDLKLDYQRDLSAIKTENDAIKIENKYSQMLDYQKELVKEGIKQTGINKPYINLTDKQGNTVALTRDQAEEKAYEVINTAKAIKTSNPDQFNKLPSWLRIKVLKDESLSASEVRRVLRDVYGATEQTDAETSLWDDDDNEKSLW